MEKAVRNLLLTEDFSLMQKLARYARDAVADHDDEALAVMVAAKRLDDYRQALKGRNTRAIDSPGTYGWILHQSARNIERIGRIPSFEELFARQAISGFAPARQ
jgi:glutamate synthase (NADPH/NADH) large chain